MRIAWLPEEKFRAVQCKTHLILPIGSTASNILCNLGISNGQGLVPSGGLF
jgi:hypothetical protein